MSRILPLAKAHTRALPSRFFRLRCDSESISNMVIAMEGYGIDP